MKMEIRFGNGGTMMTAVKCKFLEGVVYKEILGLSICYNVRYGIIVCIIKNPQIRFTITIATTTIILTRCTSRPSWLSISGTFPIAYKDTMYK